VTEKRLAEREAATLLVRLQRAVQEAVRPASPGTAVVQAAPRKEARLVVRNFVRSDAAWFARRAQIPAG
jgi:hypothetical protein